MQEMRTQWQREKTDHDRQIAEEQASLKKERHREKEEYEYTFTREQAQRKNELEDELQTLAKKIASKRSDFELSVQEQSAAREKDIDDLRKEVDGFPKRLETAVQEAVADTTKKLTRDFERDRTGRTETSTIDFNKHAPVLPITYSSERFQRYPASSAITPRT